MKKHRAFTLIELSIVLVIIGLIAGGVLVGRDLIKSYEIRAQITQIEKYNSAVNSFQNKYNALPGDMPPAIATPAGFFVGAGFSGTTLGHRNGDGMIDGASSSTTNYLPEQGQCETGAFWQDLSSPVAGNLIDGQYPNSGAAAFQCTGGFANVVTATSASQILPPAKIGHGNFVYVYEISGINWYGVSSITSVNSTGGMVSAATIPVLQAYAIDKKVDDGIPTTGNVQTNYVSGPTALAGSPNTTTAGGNSTSCYDTATNLYSITYNKGAGTNCALSFAFQ